MRLHLDLMTSASQRGGSGREGGRGQPPWWVGRELTTSVWVLLSELLYPEQVAQSLRASELRLHNPAASGSGSWMGEWGGIWSPLVPA